MRWPLPAPRGSFVARCRPPQQHLVCDMGAQRHFLEGHSRQPVDTVLFVKSQLETIVRLLRSACRPSARVVDAACPGAPDSDPGCRRRRAPPHLPLFSWPRARPAQATTRQKGHAERQAELAVANPGPVGSRRAVPQEHLQLWLIAVLCKPFYYVSTGTPPTRSTGILELLRCSASGDG